MFAACATCRWWLRNPHTLLVGECRRMPPHPSDNVVDPRWWPSTKRDDWCGEYQNAAAPTQEKAGG